MFSVFSMFSQLTPCSPIWDGRMEQLEIFLYGCRHCLQPQRNIFFWHFFHFYAQIMFSVNHRLQNNVQLRNLGLLHLPQLHRQITRCENLDRSPIFVANFSFLCLVLYSSESALSPGCKNNARSAARRCYTFRSHSVKILIVFFSFLIMYSTESDVDMVLWITGCHQIAKIIFQTTESWSAAQRCYTFRSHSVKILIDFLIKCHLRLYRGW